MSNHLVKKRIATRHAALRIGVLGTPLVLSACALQFTGPRAPTLSSVAPPPQVPRPAPTPVATEKATGSSDVAGTADPRDFTRSALGVSNFPSTDEQDSQMGTFHDLVRRLLVVKTLRVIDLSGIAEIGAAIERTSSSERLGYSGRLDRMLWLGHLVQTRYVLVPDRLDVRTVSQRVPHILKFDERAIPDYESERAAWQGACQTAVAEIERVRTPYTSEWLQAEEKYRHDLPWWGFIGIEKEYKAARAEHLGWQQRADAIVEKCRGPMLDPADLRQKDGAEAPPGNASSVEAELRFRVIEVPGGAVVLSARLVRGSDTKEEAVGRLLDGVVQALTVPPPGQGRRR